jgi:glucose-1-phosphate thymidylyltransferase
MKGLILAGGKGTRLQPATNVMNKHMVPILNKPMILYPLETLKQLGITEIMLVTGGNHIGMLAEFLGDGSGYGVHLTYRVQKDAGGIAQALALAEDFVGPYEQFAVILGDNVYQYAPKPPEAGHCGLVVKQVRDPQRFGVFYQSAGVGMIVEKPIKPPSDRAVTGLYFYTPEIFDFIRELKPSARGELEITDVNNYCLQNLPTEIIEYPGFWSDAGTARSLKEVIDYAYSLL